MMKCNFKLKNITRKWDTQQWKIEKLKEETPDGQFKKTTVKAATEIMKGTKCTLPRKEWIPEIEERRRYLQEFK